MRFAFFLFAAPLAIAQTATFEDLSLPPQSHSQDTPFTSSGAMFSSAPFSGFNYSNITDTTTVGFTNQYAAYSTGGLGAAGSATYAVCNNFSQGDGVITFPANTRPTSISITNSTYAYLSMRDGDPPPNAFAKKFGGTSGNDPDFFRLTIKGFDALGNNTNTSVSFMLADYTFGNNAQDYIISDWTTVNLASLSDTTRSLQFTLESSDNGAFGMNTPAYFAVDNVNFAPIPEPAGLFGICLLAFVGRRCRGR